MLWMLCVLMASAQQPSMSLDHVVLAVNDLEAMAARYQQLGFALKPGRPHANGIRNAHVKFRDGTELELLTAPQATDRVTTQYRRHLAEGDGPAFLSLFPRPAAPPARVTPDYVFYGQGNRSPTDRPEHFAHRNTAESLVAVWLASANFAQERALLARYGVTLRRGPLGALGETADIADLDGGALYLLPPRHRVHRARPIAGVTFRVRHLDAAAAVLRRAPVEFTQRPEFLLLPPSVTGGLWIELRSDHRRSP